MKDITYKGYTIRSLANERKTGAWTVDAYVWWGKNKGGGEQRLLCPADHHVFETQDQAEEYALSLAKRWIDQC